MDDVTMRNSSGSLSGSGSVARVMLSTSSGVLGLSSGRRQDRRWVCGRPRFWYSMTQTWATTCGGLSRRVPSNSVGTHLAEDAEVDQIMQ